MFSYINDVAVTDDFFVNVRANIVPMRTFFKSRKAFEYEIVFEREIFLHAEILFAR